MWQFDSANALQIPSGADLKSDRYKQLGVYVCNSNSDAKELINCPTKNAFILFVYNALSKSDGYIIQEFRSYNGLETIKRMFWPYNNTWGEPFTYGNSVDTTFGVRGTTTDPNMITLPGMYHSYAGTAHNPDSSHGFLIVHFDSGGRILQMACVNDSSLSVHLRSRGADLSQYSAWYKLV